MIRVYHGSDHVLRNPVYLGGKSDNDYGNGFYTTEYEERARSWAALNATPDRSIVNVYDFDIEKLKVLDLNECGVLSWIAEVVANRGIERETAGIVGKKLVEFYKPDTAEYDVIKGYRADDSYTQVIEAFLLSLINLQEVERLFYKGSLGNQVFLKSENAFKNIHWKESYEVKMSEEYQNTDIYARREVNRFLNGRVQAILLEGFSVPGITAGYAIRHRLHYHKETGEYENDSI